MKELIKKQLEAAGIKEFELCDTNAAKFNGVYRRGLEVKVGEDVSSVIDVEALEEAIYDGVPIEQALAPCMKALHNSLDFAYAAWFSDYSNVKGRLLLGVCNRLVNSVFLSDVPYFEMEDLAFYVRVLIDEEDDGRGSIIVHNECLDVWGIEKDELFADAKASSVVVQPMEILKMSALTASMGFPTDEEEDEIIDSHMRVCTNPVRIEGAAVVAYPDFYDKVAECTGWEEFYVIPSSRMEVIVMHKESHTPSEVAAEVAFVEEMIYDANLRSVPPEGLLSFSAYMFDASGFHTAGKSKRASA